MGFYEKFVSLCERKGCSAATAAREIGLSNSVTTAWKKGARPKSETLEKVAEYFDVSVNELLDMGAFPLPDDDPNRRYGINKSIDSAHATSDYLVALGLRFAHLEGDPEFPDINGGYELITNVRNNTAYIVSSREIEEYERRIESYANYEISELFSRARKKYIVCDDGVYEEID